MRTDEYKPRWNHRTFTPEQRDFLRRRTFGFLNRGGMSMPLEHLLQEAYLQGMADAVAAQEAA